MKVLIWVACILLLSIVHVLINYALDECGIILGGLGAGILTIAEFSTFWFLARWLCKKWDNHKLCLSIKQFAKEDVVCNNTITCESTTSPISVEQKTSSTKRRFCSRCGSAIDASSHRCSGCGKKCFNVKHFLLRIIPLLLGTIILAIFGIYLFSEAVPNHINYEAANKLLHSGKYHNAALAFRELGDYKDSPQKVLECNDLIAKSYVDEEQYSSLMLFVRNNQITSSTFNYIKNSALDKIDQGNYIVVFDIILTLDEVPNMQEEIRGALYRAGLDHYINEQYEISNYIFSNLGDYQNSQKLIILDLLYAEADKVTIRDLKDSPAAYDGKQIMIQACVLTLGEFFYVVDKDYFNSFKAGEDSSTSFEECPYLYIIRGYECDVDPGNLNFQDEVTIIGQFLYDAIGDEYLSIENGKIVTLTRTESYAEVRAKAIYLH